MTGGAICRIAAERIGYRKMTLQRRAQERRNNIIKTAWSGLGARVVSVTASLMMVPLAVHYLGKEQYGLWVAVSSLVAMIGFMDGGAGNAVINMVAHASGLNKEALPRIVSTAFFSLIGLALIGCLLFLAAFPFISWDRLLGVTDPASLPDLNVVVMIVGVFFFVSMFTTLVGKIQRGLQEGTLDNFWSGMAAVLSLLFAYVSIQNDTGLAGFVIAVLAGAMLAYLASSVHYLFIHRRDLCPQLGKVDSEISKNLFAVGGMFFVLQISGVVQGQADNVIIANMLGPAEVTSYSICMKLFLVPPMLFALVLAPLWPAYREALANGDMQWVRRIFFKSIRWSLLLSIPTAFVLVLMGGEIIELWIGLEAAPSTGLLIGCGIWMVFCTVGGALATLFNGMQLIKIQIHSAVLTAALNIVLSIYLIKRIGVAGAVFGSVVAWLLCSLIPYVVAARNLFIKEEVMNA